MSTIRSQALERSQGGLCEYNGCHSSNGTELHHIVKGRGNRTQCERIESVIFLCWEHHHGTNGIHGKNGHAIDLKLKIKLQNTYFELGMSEDEVRAWLGGKLYD